jgi:arabinose-5-phosphate isomerase
VADVMHHLEEVAVAPPGESMRKVVIAMTHRPLGAACIVDAKGLLAGLVTDGDVRRAFQKHEDIRPLTAADVMTVRPISVMPETSLGEALTLMEKRVSQISVLPVVDGRGRCLGLVRLHDVYKH